MNIPFFFFLIVRLAKRILLFNSITRTNCATPDKQKLANLSKISRNDLSRELHLVMDGGF